MKCPHCLFTIFESWNVQPLPHDQVLKVTFATRTARCPNCLNNIIQIGHLADGTPHRLIEITARFVHPIAYSRSPLGPEIPDEFSADYIQACNVIPVSEKASAALSRRSLQHLLREKAGAKKRDLADQIQHVLDSKQLPSHLAENLDAVRNVGNFAAHPLKSTNTGEILDVEPGEAEWLLEVLEGLFDFYFIEPAKSQRRRDALNKKLAEAGKPPLKTP